jgi:DNA polymerase elongation subunit (family B)
MARVPPGHPLSDCLPAVLRMLAKSLSDLQTGKIPPLHLVVSQTLSRPIADYRVPSPSARAATQLQEVGKERRPGQRIKFIYTYGDPGVHAWDLPWPVDPKLIDVGRYTTLMLRAAAAVLQPLGINETDLHHWLYGYGYQTHFHHNPISNTFFLTHLPTDTQNTTAKVNNTLLSITSVF